MVLVLKVCSSRNFADERSPETMIPGIKLFGRKIPAPDRHIPAESDAGSQIPTESHVTSVLSETSNREADQCRISGNSLAARAGEKADKKTADGDGAQENSDTKDELSEQEKTFKKPDKILSCPRCSSFDTKFCYFNNYNVNQPRHFCKNCQRYWTAGGTMRNVPVGAGRRKNKHFASQYRQAILSVNGMPGNKPEAPDSTNHHVLLPPAEFASAEARGTVLKFGPETSLSESIENALHLKDQYKEDPSSGGSSATTSNEQKEPMVSSASSDNYNPLSHPVHHQQIPALFLPWNNLANVGSVQWCSTPMVAIPGISCPPNIPLQIMPTPYMGCVPLCTPGTGNVPLALFNGGHCLSPSSSTSNSGSPTLGKHSRDPSAADVGVMENSVLVPKTLRVDDPNEACRSPIWTALGIKQHEKVSIMSDHVVAKGFGPKETVKGSGSAGSHIMEANPAAFSRSQTFLENT